MALKYTVQGTIATAIAGAGVAPTLKNLAAGGRKLGDAIDNTDAADRDRSAYWEVLLRFAVAPTAGGLVSIYTVPAVDGTNYSSGSDSLTPPANLLIWSFPVVGVDTAQRLASKLIHFPAGLWKPFLINSADQALTNTDNENVLRYRIVNVEDV